MDFCYDDGIGACLGALDLREMLHHVIPASFHRTAWFDELEAACFALVEATDRMGARPRVPLERARDLAGRLLSLVEAAHSMA